MHWIKNEAPDLHFEDDWAWVYSNSNSSLYQSVDGWLLHQMKSIQLHREEERRGGVSNICQHCSCRCQYSVWWLVSSRLKLNWVVLGPRWLRALPGSPVTNMSYLTMQPLAQNFIHNVSRSITSLWLSLQPACLGRPAPCLREESWRSGRLEGPGWRWLVENMTNCDVTAP